MFAAPNYLLEESICNYLTTAAQTSGSALSGSIFTAYTGIGNVDLIEAPAVIVDASDTEEVSPFTRNYRFHTKIMVKEMAADTTTLGALAGAIMNEFVDSPTASQSFTNTGSYNIAVWQVITQGMITSTSGDALVNTFDVTIIGAITP